MNVFEKLKENKKIDLSIYLGRGVITHTIEEGYNEYTIVADRIEFTKNKKAYTPFPKDYNASNININIFINNEDNVSKRIEVTSPYIASLNVESTREMAPIYTLGNIEPRPRYRHKIKLKTTVNIEESTLMFKLNTNSMRIHASDLSHSIIGTPFIVSDNDGRWRINGTEMRGVLSYE